MTVYESVAVWLGQVINENGLSDVRTIIDLEILPNFMESDGWQDTALFSSPNDIHVPMLSGKTRNTVTKTWYIKREFLQHPDRLETERFMEALTKAIREKANDCDYPQDGREWIGIRIEGGIYPYHRDENNATAIYLINLRLEYIE